MIIKKTDKKQRLINRRVKIQVKYLRKDQWKRS